MDTKENSYSSTNSTRMAGKMKQRKNEHGEKKRERHKKKSKQLTTGGFPNNYFSRRQLRAEKG